MKKCAKRIALLLTIAFLFVWLFSLVRCEVLTHRYCHEFESAWQDNPMLGEMEYFKVLSCDGEYAKVYYVSQGHTDANVLSFQNIDGTWTETGWDTIWSVSGSASDTVWPYWWHIIYGGL